MSKTDTDKSLKRPSQQWGYYIVQDTPVYYDDKGQVSQPATYHTHHWDNSALLGSVEWTRIQRYGHTNPNYATLKGTPNLLPNGFYYYKRHVDKSEGINHTFRDSISGSPPLDDYDYSSPTGQVSHSGFLATSDDLSSLDSRGRLKLYEKIKDQSVNVAQVIAEADMTAKTVLDAARRIAKAGSAYHRGDLAGAASALAGFKGNPGQAAADNWLALQYGWKPLLQDVHGSVEALSKVINNFTHDIARSSVSQTYSHMKVEHPEDFGSHGYDNKTSFGRETVTFKYSVTFVRDNPGLVTAQQLGLTNPLAVAWELMPFSFVADWFLPVGSFLSSLDARLGLSFKSGFRTTVRSASGTQAWESSYLYDDGRKFVRNCISRGTEFGVWRDPYSDWPSLALPTFKNPLSIGHALNAIALLQQVFHKR